MVQNFRISSCHLTTSVMVEMSSQKVRRIDRLRKESATASTTTCSSEGIGTTTKWTLDESPNTTSFAVSYRHQQGHKVTAATAHPFSVLHRLTPTTSKALHPPSISLTLNLTTNPFHPPFTYSIKHRTPPLPYNIPPPNTTPENVHPPPRPPRHHQPSIHHRYPLPCPCGYLCRPDLPLRRDTLQGRSVWRRGLATSSAVRHAELCAGWRDGGAALLRLD